MKISELGEFGLIDLLAKMVGHAQDKQLTSELQLIIGIGDDAAAWHGDTTIQLATVDSLIQDVHFSLAVVSWNDLGWKALAANLSDIAAMGGVPRYALVSLALPGHIEVEDIIALYQGMIELAQPSGVTIVGGDTTSAPHVAITVTLFASSSGQDKHILTRSAAKPGEKVAVTGELGAAAAGWEILTQKPRFAPEFTASLRSAFLRPHPRINEGQLLVEQGVKTAIDTSDGLISDLSHICKASHVSARIEADRVPIQSVLKTNFGGRALELALSGGEDYELLFTASAETITKVKMAASCPVTIIGDIIADKPGKITLVDSQGSPFNLHQAGWEHFGPRRQN